MNAIRKSLLMVMSHLGGPKKTLMLNIITETHCDNKHPYDFYCDAEKPFIANF